MHKNCPQNKSVIKNGKIYTGCDICIESQLPKSGEFSAKFNRDWQRREYQKDLIQPNQPRDFSRAYPDKAREMYGDESYRKYS